MACRRSEGTTLVSLMSVALTALTGLRLPDRWGLGALVIAAVVLGPLVAILWMAFNPAENIWPHLMATTLPRYLLNTVLLCAGVGTLSAAVGTVT